MNVKDLFFPKLCVGCGATGNYICSVCITQIQALKPACPYCGKASIDGFTHSRCAKKWGLDGLIAVWPYEKVIKKAIWNLKFKYALDLAEELAGLYCETLKNNQIFIPRFGNITAVPMFWYKENLRGFNQSDILAEKMGKLLGLQTVKLLEKVRPTSSQVDLNYMDRKKNLKGAFAILPGKVMEKYINVFLFDDVFTTGSTLKEACRILKIAGVQHVWGITLVRKA